MDAFQQAEEFLGKDTCRAALNFAYSRHLTVLSYNAVNDLWHLSDGEMYTTTIILREAVL